MPIIKSWIRAHLVSETLVSWCPDTIAGLPPVTWNVPNPELINEFSSVLQEARSEQPLQSFFGHHPLGR